MRQVILVYRSFWGENCCRTKQLCDLHFKIREPDFVFVGHFLTFVIHLSFLGNAGRIGTCPSSSCPCPH